MGETRVNVRIFGRKQSEELKGVVVDTSSVSTVLPKKLADRLGVDIVSSDTGEDVSGNRFAVEIGVARISLEGKEAMIPVAVFDASEALIGLTTLETQGFKVNPVTGLLEKTALKFRTTRLEKSVSHRRPQISTLRRPNIWI